MGLASFRAFFLYSYDLLFAQALTIKVKDEFWVNLEARWQYDMR